MVGIRERAKNTLGYNIEAIIKNKGLTHDDVCDLFIMSKWILSRYISGEATVPAIWLHGFCKLFKVRIETMFEGEFKYEGD